MIKESSPVKKNSETILEIQRRNAEGALMYQDLQSLEGSEFEAMYHVSPEDAPITANAAITRVVSDSRRDNEIEQTIERLSMDFYKQDEDTIMDQPDASEFLTNRPTARKLL